MEHYRTMARIGVLILLFCIAGCAGQGRINYLSPQEAFDKGMVEYERGRYSRAAQYFRGVFDFGRDVPIAADAQLMLARSYRGSKDYLLAGDEYSRFGDLYRTDPRVADAEFERAMGHFEQSPNFELDQRPTLRSIEQFSLFMRRYPQHDSIHAAERRVAELREKLAYKQFFNAQQYERRGLFEAAGLSYEVVFNQYPETPLADDALLGAMRSYISFSDQSIAQRQAERLQKAIDSYERLVQIFPDSELIGTAEPMYQRANARIGELSGGAPGPS